MIEYLYQQPLFYVAIGVIAGVGLLHVRAQGAQAWARNLWMLVALSLIGGGTAYVVTRISPEYGSTVVFYALLAAWAVSWILFGLIALWRNNVVIGLELDDYLIRGLVAIGVAVLAVYWLVNDVDHEDVVWAYLAVPSLAGAFYRLLLVVEFVRLPVHDREAMGLRIDRRLRGEGAPERPAVREPAVEEVGSGEADPTEEQKKLLFNPFDVRGDED